MSKVLGASLTTEQQLSLWSDMVNGAWMFTPHALTRMEQYDVSRGEVFNAMALGSIVEFHTDAGTRRLLIRYQGKCVVCDLDTRDVITYYFNDMFDHHATLDRSQYQNAVTDKEVGL